MAAEIVVGTAEVWQEKDKDARKTYQFNLGALLNGDTLASAVWSVTPAGAVVTENDSVSGVTAKVTVSGGAQKTWYVLLCRYTTAAGDVDELPVKLYIKEDTEAGLQMGSALFPNKFTAIASLRNDRLFGAARGTLPSFKPTDDYLWGKLLAAEADIATQLRVELQPTRFFPLEPTQAQIDALNGMPWKLDPAYDYEPAMFIGEKWGFVVFRNKPIIEYISGTINYPRQDASILDLPNDWVRIDKKYGMLNFVPASPVVSANFATTLLGGLIGANKIPFSLHFNYIAGLANASKDFPQLVDAVMKLAVLKIIQDSFLPQSGSISADGLSQSMSLDIAKYHDMVDTIINGPKGSNAGLMTAIHGIRLGVM